MCPAYYHENIDYPYITWIFFVWIFGIVDARDVGRQVFWYTLVDEFGRYFMHSYFAIQSQNHICFFILIP